VSKLLTLSPDWAKDKVEETETQLADIRREASHLVKAIIYIKHAKEAAAGTFDTSKARGN
jgi:hypothetical protein